MYLKRLFLLLLFQLIYVLAWGQHYQRLVNEITACDTYACIEGIMTKAKTTEAFIPVKRDFGLEAQRVLVDFSYPYKIKNVNKAKNYRLSLFVYRDSIYYGQLDQLEGKQLETSFLFINDVNYLQNHLAKYNQQNKTAHSYKDLTSSIISREPGFWMWRN